MVRYSDADDEEQNKYGAFIVMLIVMMSMV